MNIWNIVDGAASDNPDKNTDARSIPYYDLNVLKKMPTAFNTSVKVLILIGNRDHQLHEASNDINF